MKKTNEDTRRLDRLGQTLVRAAAPTDAEVDAVAPPHLYDRVRARMEAERGRRAASATWLDILAIGRWAVPAMFAIALALLGRLWIQGSRSIAGSAAGGDIRAETEVLNGIAMVSDDDVLALLMSGPVPEAPARENQPRENQPVERHR